MSINFISKESSDGKADETEATADYKGLYIGKFSFCESIGSAVRRERRPTYQVNNWIGEGHLLYVNKEARNKSARWLQLPGDSKFRALNILTEKDFSDEELGRIIPKSDADSNDAAYLDAVKRGDIEKAERMVREAVGCVIPKIGNWQHW